MDAYAAASPLEATIQGISGHDTELDDLSVDGYEHRADLARRTLQRLAGCTPIDDVDRVTVAAMQERLGLRVEIHEAGYELMDVNVIASPLQSVRDVFDLMPTGSDQEWSDIATRMVQVPRALQQWRQTLRASADRGHVSARRQIAQCILQCEDLTGPEGYFATVVAQTRSDDGPPSTAVRRDLERAAALAAQAYRDLGEDLRTHLLGRAPAQDAVGPERYRLASRSYLGARVDLAETYEWGQAELAGIEAQMRATAELIRAGSSVVEAGAILDADPRRRLSGTDALRAWMQERADEAVDELAGTHFDIPGPARTIECRIAPTHTGGIYYTGPSEDFSRPGRMWWSVPRSVTEFGTWRELSTVYHEGVPGHHLQIAQTVFRSDLLNRWRRLLCWVSGHGEGWALYAERLMAELGFLDDPGAKLGYLDGQSLRAARVVLDVGVHCGFEAPASVGGGAWSYEKAWSFLTAHAHQDQATLRFELDRYLGWPGQAPSYKIGERLWLELREESRRRRGPAFSAKDFHRRALDVGSVGLDVLRHAADQRGPRHAVTPADRLGAAGLDP